MYCQYLLKYTTIQETIQFAFLCSKEYSEPILGVCNSSEATWTTCGHYIYTPLSTTTLEIKLLALSELQGS